MSGCIHYCRWYTVWDRQTDELITAGTSEMCARKLGFKSANSFASMANHTISGSQPSSKYIFMQERIRRSEVDSLPPVQTYGRGKKKQPAGAGTPTGCRG